MISVAIVIGLLIVLLASCGVALSRVQDLYKTVVLLSVYSGLISLIFAILGAVDVAFTEAVVGTGISTVFLIALLRQVDSRRITHAPWLQKSGAVLVAVLLGAAMLLGVLALPPFGSPTAPQHAHVAPVYIENAEKDMHTPNVVTAVLADYRAFDTLIETTVVLTGALACLMVVGRKRRVR